MTASDRMELTFYDYTHGLRVSEHERCELYRVALLAVQYRAMLNERRRKAKAIAKVKEERALIGASRDHSPGGEGSLSLCSRQSGGEQE